MCQEGRALSAPFLTQTGKGGSDGGGEPAVGDPDAQPGQIDVTVDICPDGGGDEVDDPRASCSSPPK